MSLVIDDSTTLSHWNCGKCFFFCLAIAKCLCSRQPESKTAETQSGLPFVLHLRQKCNLFVFSFFLVYNNV